MNVGISLRYCSSLLEILRLIKDFIIASLPNTLSSLKHRVNRQLSLFAMRTKEIFSTSDKLLTDAATQKNGQYLKTHEKLYFFDKESIFKRFMSSEIASIIHIGFAHWKDSPIDLLVSCSCFTRCMIWETYSCARTATIVRWILNYRLMIIFILDYI